GSSARRPCAPPILAATAFRARTTPRCRPDTHRLPGTRIREGRTRTSVHRRARTPEVGRRPASGPMTGAAGTEGRRTGPGRPGAAGRRYLRAPAVAADRRTSVPPVAACPVVVPEPVAAAEPVARAPESCGCFRRRPTDRLR